MQPTRDAALDAVGRLRMNPDFAARAKAVSKDASAPAGGDLGWVPLDSVDPAIGAVVFAMNPRRGHRNPVRTAAGWFLIRDEGVRQQGAPGFELARERLRREMIGEQMAAMRAEIAATVCAEPGKIPSIELEKKKKQSSAAWADRPQAIHYLAGSDPPMTCPVTCPYGAPRL